MNPDGTINAIRFARDLDGTSGLERARRLNLWITAAHATAVSVGHDTTALLNATAAVMWLRRQLDLTWKGV